MLADLRLTSDNRDRRGRVMVPLGDVCVCVRSVVNACFHKTLLFVTNILDMMTREDDSQHKLSGQQCTSTQRICPQIHYKHAPRADDISGVAVGNAGARFGAGAVQPGNWRCAADQHRNAMSSTERGRMILLRSVLDVGWSAARRTGKKSSSEADERHGSGTRAHPPSCMSSHRKHP